MKIVLLKDVKGVGKKGQILSVKDGYAINMLIPRGFAVKATDRSLEVLDKQNQDALNAKIKAEDEARNVAKQLEKIVLEFDANIGKDGKMFGTISYKQIEEKLKSEYDITIDKRKFIDRTPVDRLGYTRLQIELYKGVKGVVIVHVNAKK